MSDALSDITRDQQRGEAIDVYYELLIRYINGEALINDLHKVAQEIDDIRGSYWGSGHTTFKQHVSEQADRLKAGDKKEWAYLLRTMERSRAADKLRRLSPWGKDAVFIPVYYNHANTNELIRDLKVKHRKKIGDKDHYLIILKQPKTIEII